MTTHFRILSGPEFTDAEIAEAARTRTLLSMELEMSRQCNFRCTYCYVGDPPPPVGELTPDEVRDVILQAKALGARKIILLGGEPMIHPDIIGTIAWIREQDLAVELFTNGTNMTPEAANELFSRDVAVVLKFNSFDPAIQDALAGFKGAHRVIRNALGNLMAAGYPTKTARLCISSILCRQNRHEAVKLWEWARERDIEPYLERVNPMEKGACNRDKLELEPRELEKVFNEIAELDRTKFGIDWNPQPPLVGNKCLRHLFSCLVNATGDVMPCVGVTVPIGNIRDRRLGDILQDSEVVQDLRDHAKTIQGPCGSCEKAADCYGCRGTAYQTTGSYLASDPLCWHNCDRQSEILRLPTPAAPFLPQRQSACLIDRLVSLGERSAVVETVIPAGSLYALEDGRVDETVYLELIAQAIAAQNGFRLRPELRASAGGMLLGAKKLEISGFVHVGDLLRIEVRKTARFDDFGIIHGTVSHDGDVIASGEIKVYSKTLPLATKEIHS